MWDAQSCPGGANCGGDSNVVIAVIDTGVAFEAYDDQTGFGFTGNNYTAQASDLNGGTFNLWQNTDTGFSGVAEIANDGLDNDCNGVIDDLNGIDTFAFRTLDLDTSNTCTGAYVPYDFSDSAYLYKRKPGHPIDTYGHGTYVTNVIAGRSDNGNGTVAPAFNTTIMPIAASIEFSGSSYGWFYDTDVMTGISYASAYGADVINLSIGGAYYNQSYQDTINFYTENFGVVIVASSGNENRWISYPAAYDNVIAVGSANSNNTRSSYSNYGPELDLVAYVGDTGSQGRATFAETLTCFSCTALSNFSTTTAYYAVGTSFAAPQVSAAAAIIIGNNPGISPAEVRLALVQSTNDIGDTGFDQQTGNGVLDYEKAYAFNDSSLQKYYFPAYSHNGGNLKADIKVMNLDGVNRLGTSMKFGSTNAYGVSLQPGGRSSFSTNQGGVAVEVITDSNAIITQKATVNGSLNEYPAISESDLSTQVLLSSLFT